MQSPAAPAKVRLLFVVEGNTDIRFVDGLSRYFDLTLLVPRLQFRSSGLKQRVEKLGLTLRLHEIAGGRFGYQWRSFLWLLVHARKFDLILAQEMLRGALNAAIAGKVAGVPVVAMVGIPAVEYFDCRRQRRQISWPKWQLGRNVIKGLLRLNGKLLTAGFGMGEYHQTYIGRFVKKSFWSSYYGVNLAKFRCTTSGEKTELRTKLGLPANAFLVLYSSRISHEKDPETLLTACKIARARGVPLQVLNLGGGFENFVKLGQKLAGADAATWIMGRSAIHPMENLADYYRACDVLVQSSLFEGVAYCTMEALACQLPVIATNVGGMKAQLGPYAEMVPPQDATAMAKSLESLYQNPTLGRNKSTDGARFIKEVWDSEKGFQQLARDFAGLAKTSARSTSGSPPAEFRQDHPKTSSA